jgi:hypothetical protein
MLVIANKYINSRIYISYNLLYRSHYVDNTELFTGIYLLKTYISSQRQVLIKIENRTKQHNFKLIIARLFVLLFPLPNIIEVYVCIKFRHRRTFFNLFFLSLLSLSLSPLSFFIYSTSDIE